MKTHEVKSWIEFFEPILSGRKMFELRKNDRDYKVYDMVYLHETVNGIKTGRKLQGKEIKYVLYGGEYGLDKDYCIMQF